MEEVRREGWHFVTSPTEEEGPFLVKLSVMVGCSEGISIKCCIIYVLALLTAAAAAAAIDNSLLRNLC